MSTEIRENFVVLCQELDVARIVPILRQEKLLTADEFELLTNPLISERVRREKLLIMLPRKGKNHFQRFSECLVWSGQEALATRIGIDLGSIRPRPDNIPPPAPPQQTDQGEMFSMLQRFIAQGSLAPVPGQPMSLPGGGRGYPMATQHLSNSLPPGPGTYPPPAYSIPQATGPPLTHVTLPPSYPQPHPPQPVGWQPPPQTTQTAVPHPLLQQAPPPEPRTARGRPPRVLLLYCKDPGSNGDDVLDLADLLQRSGGIQCEYDGYDGRHPTNWGVWTENMIQECDFVLFVCSQKFSDHLRNPEHVLIDMTKGKFWCDTIVNLIDAQKFIPVFLNSSCDQRLIPAALKAATHYELLVNHLVQDMDGTPEEQFTQRLEELLQDAKYNNIASLMAFLRGEQYAMRPQQPLQPVKISGHGSAIHQQPYSMMPQYPSPYHPSPPPPSTEAEFIAEGDLLRIAERLPREWQHLGIKLGVEYSTLEILRSRHPFDPRQSTMEMFGKWQQLKGKQASRERLKQALIELGYGRVAKEVFGSA